VTTPKYSDAEKAAALRELENAHFECGLWDSPSDGPYAPRQMRAFAASRRMREILGLPLNRVPPVPA
jgi:hypothetical protein